MTDLDTHFPPRGPCAFCGDPDARHRLFDAIRDRVKAGESVADVAADYDVTPAAVLAVIQDGERL